MPERGRIRGVVTRDKPQARTAAARGDCHLAPSPWLHHPKGGRDRCSFGDDCERRLSAPVGKHGERCPRCAMLPDHRSYGRRRRGGLGRRCTARRVLRGASAIGIGFARRRLSPLRSLRGSFIVTVHQPSLHRRRTAAESGREGAALWHAQAMSPAKPRRCEYAVRSAGPRTKATRLRRSGAAHACDLNGPAQPGAASAVPLQDRRPFRCPASLRAARRSSPSAMQARRAAALPLLLPTPVCPATRA